MALDIALAIWFCLMAWYALILMDHGDLRRFVRHCAMGGALTGVGWLLSQGFA